MKKNIIIICTTLLLLTSCGSNIAQLLYDGNEVEIDKVITENHEWNKTYKVKAEDSTYFLTPLEAITKGESKDKERLIEKLIEDGANVDPILKFVQLPGFRAYSNYKYRYPENFGTYILEKAQPGSLYIKDVYFDLLRDKEADEKFIKDIFKKYDVYNTVIKDKYENKAFESGIIGNRSLDIMSNFDYSEDITNSIISRYVKSNKNDKAVDFVRYLVAKAIDFDPNFKFDSSNFKGGSYIHEAADNGNYNLVNYFLKIGSDITAVTEKGSTVLHHAAWGGNLEIVKLCLDYGVDMYKKTTNDSSNQAHNWAALAKHDHIYDYLMSIHNSRVAEADRLEREKKAKEKQRKKIQEEANKNANVYRYGWNTMKNMVENENKNLVVAFSTIVMGLEMNSKLKENEKDWLIAGATDYYKNPNSSPKY